MRIAIVGTRGIPARYGGFETFAEQLGTRLAARGHRVTVFGRSRFFSRFSAPAVGGVHRVAAWTIFQKHLETPLASLTSFLYLVFAPVDVILLCNAANSIFSGIARLRGIPVLINVDGVERKRAKWGRVARWWYRIGEVCSLLFGSRVIADAYSIGEYYAAEYGFAPTLIAYGAEAEPAPRGAAGDRECLGQFGVLPGEYLLYVSRLEPENNALGVVQAYERSKVSLPLVVVGDAPYANEYIARVRAAAGPRVIFLGYQFGESYQALQRNCALYIQATEVGGTHPALIESMAHGNAILANGVPEHFEVLGGAGLYYPRNDFGRLAELLRLLGEDRARRARCGALAAARAKRLFSWEVITDRYEDLCRKVLQ
ncbi:DUF1972 domain-containing protein [bacterium]|nr:DUF1972 domain-containing protein [bacterium]